MWVSGSAFENAKRWRTMKTRLGFIVLVVVACHCILIQRSKGGLPKKTLPEAQRTQGIEYITQIIQTAEAC